MDSTLYWYNFVTDEYDAVAGPITSDEQAELYLPQLAGVALYRIWRGQYDLPILEAMVKVLDAAIGEAAPDDGSHPQ